jgi:meso-butanediol dehydrogenase / (S,S)-butanediol dehydrogenase / diacetyl reductase
VVSTLRDLTCLITGAAGGIGSAIARRLSREGARVVLCDLARDPVDALAEELTGESLAISLDVVDEQAMTEAADAAVERFGSLDVVFNNAGISMLTPLETITRADFDRLMGVNVYGLVVGCKVAAEVMRNQPSGGKIINTCSCAGKRAAALSTLYVASKFAVRGITQSLALELAPYGITVNAICPGIVDTPLWKPIGDDLARQGLLKDPADVLEMMSSQVALGHPSVPDDVAGLAAFLASPDANYMTGQAVNIDGGIAFD